MEHLDPTTTLRWGRPEASCTWRTPDYRAGSGNGLSAPGLDIPHPRHGPMLRTFGKDTCGSQPSGRKDGVCSAGSELTRKIRWLPQINILANGTSKILNASAEFTTADANERSKKA